MKHLLVSILSFATIDAAADTKTVDRVNYHLKMIHTKMQTQEAQAQVKAHEVERSHTGDGMDFIKNDPRYGITPNDDLDTPVAHPFTITPPVKAQRVPTQSDEMSPEEKAESGKLVRTVRRGARRVGSEKKSVVRFTRAPSAASADGGTTVPRV